MSRRADRVVRKGRIMKRFLLDVLLYLRVARDVMRCLLLAVGVISLAIKLYDLIRLVIGQLLS